MLNKNLYLHVTEVALLSFQGEHQLEAFFDARYGLLGVYDSCAYHHQIHPGNET